MQLALANTTSDAEHLLSVLRARSGEWVPDLYSRCSVMVHSRVADLRKRGHAIECKRFGGKDYRYRLVAPPTDERGKGRV